MCPTVLPKQKFAPVARLHPTVRWECALLRDFTLALALFLGQHVRVFTPGTSPGNPLTRFSCQVQSTRESPPTPLFQNRTCDFHRILAPLPESLCHRYQMMIRHHLAWNMYFQCHSDLAHERGTTRCVRTPALPENKNPLLTALSDFSTLLHPFLLSESAHVSVSGALPPALAF